MFTKRLKRGTRSGEKGQSLAEFVMVLPIFLILVFGIIDFGMGFHAWLTITNSAREGARLGAVRATEPDIKQRVRDTAASLQDCEDGTIKCPVTVTNAQGTSGESVVVKVDYDYDLITPLDSLLGLISGGAVGPTLTFSSTADMRLE